MAASLGPLGLGSSLAPRAQPQLQLRSVREAEPAICKQPIYRRYRLWSDIGLWERILNALRSVADDDPAEVLL
jgi:hypothetical protein